MAVNYIPRKSSSDLTHHDEADQPRVGLGEVVHPDTEQDHDDTVLESSEEQPTGY